MMIKVHRASMALALLGAAMAINVLYVTVRFGDRGGLLFAADDQFADFVKFVMSFPGGPIRLPDPLGHDALLTAYRDHNPYIDGIGNRHVPPLTVVIACLSRQLMTIVPPLTLYAGLAVAYLGTLAVLIGRLDWRWAVIAVLSYPLWFLIDRGNLFAGITALCMMAALIRAKSDWTAALLLAVAISIRPNAVIVALPLLALDWRLALRLAAMTAPLNLVALAVATQLYPDYSLPAFLDGLARYRASFVDGTEGIAFGSSIDGAMRFLFSKAASVAAAFLPLVYLPFAVILFKARKLTYDAFAFCCVAVYALATSALADYHLLVFLAPLVLVTQQDRAFWPAFLTCCFVLAPKNYQWPGDTSWQVALNPAVMFVGLLATLVVAFLSSRERTTAAT